MKLLRFAPLALIGLVGGAQAEASLELPQIDHVVVRKGERTITLYAQGEAVRIIGGIQLGDVPMGPKRFQGDERTPEGRYLIDYGNPESAYYLSLHISYPSARDATFAEAQGRSPGGQIFIHGQPNGWRESRVPGDWTDGCIAVSNEEMEALWQSVPDGTVIDILP